MLQECPDSDSSCPYFGVSPHQAWVAQKSVGNPSFLPANVQLDANDPLRSFTHILDLDLLLVIFLRS